MNLYKRLRYALKKRNIAPIELSNITNIDKASISNYLNNKYEPKKDKVKIISDALKINPFWLLGFEPFFFENETKQDHISTINLLINFIKEFIQNKNISIDDFLTYSNIDFEDFKLLLEGKKMPQKNIVLLVNMYLIRQISNALDIDENMLLELINDNPELSENKYVAKASSIENLQGAKRINIKSRSVKLPILGTVPASFGHSPCINADEWINCPIDILPYSENPEERYYILKVSGDSMYPLLQDRDLIIVDIKKELKNGDIGVFRIDDETTVKTYYKFPDRIELDPYNKEAFKTMVYPLKQLQELGFEIQGKVIGLYFRPI